MNPRCAHRTAIVGAFAALLSLTFALGPAGGQGMFQSSGPPVVATAESPFQDLRPTTVGGQGSGFRGFGATPVATRSEIPGYRPTVVSGQEGVPSWRATDAVPTAASGAGEAVFMLRPTRLDLAGAAARVEVWVEGAPEVTGFELELGFDPSLVAVTAIEAGQFLSTTGGTVLLTPRFTEPGTLALAGEVTLADGFDAPSGSGVLAVVTLAPLAGGGPAALEVTSPALVGVGGDDVAVARTLGGEVVVSMPPDPALQVEVAAQATALADALPAGAPGFPLGLPDVTRHSSELIWLGLLAMACAVVAVGWLVGRRPPPREPPAASGGYEY